MREKELRLALVCYGGISLAVYMHGITKEIWRLARASQAYHEGSPPADGSSPHGDSHPFFHIDVGGIHGDIATASIVINSIPKVLGAPPGLRTMRDLPLPSFSSGR